MTENRWTDDFLNSLRMQGDPLADETVEKMLKDGTIQHAGELFRTLKSNDDQVADKRIPELTEFVATTKGLPKGTDLKRIERGEAAFMRSAFPACLALLCKSLPEGYAAPNLSLILNISKNLEKHPYARLIAVLQLVVNVGAHQGFQDDGRAVITAQKVRLLHAGIRQITNKYVPDYSKSYQVPVNHEDMLATIMGFSLLVITGLEALDVPLKEQEAEDLLYLWCVFAQMCGIYPPGKPESMEYLPTSVADAKAFYAAFGRRHYANVKDNPDGVELTRANIKMLEDMIPWPLRLFGLKVLPKVYLVHMTGVEAARRVGVSPVWGHTIFKKIAFGLTRLITFVWRKVNRVDKQEEESGHHHRTFSNMVMQFLIDEKFGGAVEFTIPATLKNLHNMVKRP
ncbi:MAG: oxygenase MpaB family protein [Calditrichia bacterium]